MLEDYTVEMQLEVEYFEAGWIALKSFRQHNPRCSFVVRDYGLRPQQKELMSRFANVIGASSFTTSQRFSYVCARMNAFSSLVADNGFTLFLDADTLTTGSIDPWLKSLSEARSSFSLVREERRFKLRRQINPQALSLFPRMCEYADQPGYNWGVMLVHRTSEAVCLLRALSEQFLTLLTTKLSDATWFKFYDQTFGNCFFMERKVDILQAEEVFNALVRGRKCHVDRGVLLCRGKPSVITHFISGAFQNALRKARPKDPVLAFYKRSAEPFLAELGSLRYAALRASRHARIRPRMGNHPLEEGMSKRTEEDLAHPEGWKPILET